MKKAVCVTSGGMDSITNSLMMLKKGYEVYLMHFSIGQRSERGEKASCRFIASKLQEEGYPIKLEIVKTPVFGEDSCLTNENIPVPEGMDSLRKSATTIDEIWTPARNVVFLALAASYAEHIEAEYITLGTNASEWSYKDNTKEFLDRFSHMLEYGCNKFIPKVISPENEMDKPEILKWGHDNGFGWIYNYTWSCDLAPIDIEDNPVDFRTLMATEGKCGCCCNRRLAHLIVKEKYGIEDGQKYGDPLYFKQRFIPEALQELKGKLADKLWYRNYEELIRNAIG